MRFLLSSNFGKVLVNNTKHQMLLSRTITTKKIVRPPPFPYKRKNFTFPDDMFENTEDRLNENSRIIVVDGPIASGKTELCKKLAEDLDMFFLPPANMDMFYKYGDFDFRSLDNLVSNENMKSYDEKNFCQNPKHINVAVFQIRMLIARFKVYIDALAHMLSTGQGVITMRSPFSDFVFVEAMTKSGYLKRRCRDIYYELKRNTIPPLFKPHVVIYLDVPISKIKENVKKRNLPYEKNSPIFNDEYLSTMENCYKDEYLPFSSKNSEVLVYDWSEGGDAEVVVEDLERIDFDSYDHFSEKLKQWREMTTEEWNDCRKNFADNQQQYLQAFNVVERYDEPELIYSAHEVIEFEELLKDVPEFKYLPGCDPNKDGNLLFKVFFTPKENQRLRLPFLQ